ncbi:MAG: restriction endonuclease subunit S [Acidobacteria bacterium]|nr:restriction endonuclease subunit S [Acidobacteriota bacterium]
MNSIKYELLSRIAYVMMGQSPPSSSCSENGNGFPFIQGNAEFGARHPNPRLKCSLPTRIAEAGDLLLSVRAPVGEINQAVTRTVIGRGLSAIRVDEQSRAFMWHALKWAAPQLNRVAQGSTFVAVNRQDVERLELPWSDVFTCSRIATMLNTIDALITHTEAVIAKLKQIRAGLLHDLLTRGLDENGELRDPVAHPEQFKDSSLGRIPKEWDICGILDIAPTDRQPILTGPFGAQLSQRDFVRDGIPVLRISNVQSGYIDWSGVQYVSTTKAIELKRFSINSGDLLFARQGATTGRNALADKRADGVLINYHIIRVAVDRNLCEPIFLHALFNNEQAQRQINRDKGRGTREGINTVQISSLRFALPPVKEQQRAVAVLANHDANEIQEVVALAKLHQLKSGLITDLLTGRVRVPESIDLAETNG